MPMVMFMMDIGSTIKLMVLECTAISMEQSMRVNGKKINNTVMVLKLGLMALDIKENTSKARNMVKANSHGLMEAHLLDSSLITISKDRVSTIGPMEENSTDLGKTIRWREVVFSRGQTEEDTKETM